MKRRIIFRRAELSRELPFLSGNFIEWNIYEFENINKLVLIILHINNLSLETR